MKTRWLLLALILVFGFACAIACGGGDDDDDDNAGDDDDDDDSGDDDDTTGDDDDDNGLVVQNVDQGDDCLDGGDGKDMWDPLINPTNVIQVTWENGVLAIEDLYAYINCCVELEVTAEAAGNVVTVTETDTGTVCDCNCPFNFSYEIAGLQAEAITLRIQRVDAEAKAATPIFELPLTLGDTNKAWVVPYVEVFMGGEIADPYQVRYGACNLYHQDDQQFMVRQAGYLWSVFSYDWYDLDNPGTPDPNCQIPVWIEVGSLEDGTNYFGAPSFHEDEWSMLNFTIDN